MAAAATKASGVAAETRARRSGPTSSSDSPAQSAARVDGVERRDEAGAGVHVGGRRDRARRRASENLLAGLGTVGDWVLIIKRDEQGSVLAMLYRQRAPRGRA